MQNGTIFKETNDRDKRTISNNNLYKNQLGERTSFSITFTIISHKKFGDRNLDELAVLTHQL